MALLSAQRPSPVLLPDFARHPVPGVCGLEADLTGVELDVRLTAGPDPTGESQSWQTMHHGQIGKDHLGSSTGGSVLVYVTKDDYWDNFEEDIQQGLKALPPAAAFVLAAGLQTERRSCLQSGRHRRVS